MCGVLKSGSAAITEIPGPTGYGADGSSGKVSKSDDAGYANQRIISPEGWYGGGEHGDIVNAFKLGYAGCILNYQLYRIGAGTCKSHCWILSIGERTVAEFPVPRSWITGGLIGERNGEGAATAGDIGGKIGDGVLRHRFAE